MSSSKGMVATFSNVGSGSGMIPLASEISSSSVGMGSSGDGELSSVEAMSCPPLGIPGSVDCLAGS